MRIAKAPGNAEDTLIFFGALRLLDEIGIYPVIAHTEKIARASNVDVVLFTGGGGLISGYFGWTKLLAVYASRAKLVIVLPSTIRGHQDFFSALPSNIVVLCRKEMSYFYCKATIPRSNERVFFAHDLAFNADLKSYQSIKPTRSHLFAFRIDSEVHENRNIQLPECNSDISELAIIDVYTSWEEDRKTMDAFLKKKLLNMR